MDYKEHNETTVVPEERTCSIEHKGRRCCLGGKGYNFERDQHPINWKILKHGFEGGNNTGGHIIVTIGSSLLNNSY